jgi:CelD/BcsL family acetyltransferase involved in cellulose biosynthesis
MRGVYPAVIKRGFVKAELHTTEAVFDTLKDEWDSLLHPERSTDFFMSLAWQRTWWQHLGRGNLAVVAIRDDNGKLIGLGPWFIEEVDNQCMVRTIGCQDVSDYLSALAKPGFESPVFSTLFEYMHSSEAPLWDNFALCSIPQDNPTLTLLPQIAEGFGLVTSTEQEDVCPIIYLPDDYEGYLEQLDKKQRHELRRKRRRAEENGVSCYIVGPEHDLNAEIEAFFALMATSSPDKADFLTKPGHKEFFRAIGREMFDAGILQLMFLLIENQRVAAMWQFAYQDRMMLYNSGLNQSAFPSLSPGVVLLTFSIEEAVQRGFKIYDFLQGDEEYKYRMGSVTTTVHNLNIRRQ